MLQHNSLQHLHAMSLDVTACELGRPVNEREELLRKVRFHGRSFYEHVATARSEVLSARFATFYGRKGRLMR